MTTLVFTPTANIADTRPVGRALTGFVLGAALQRTHPPHDWTPTPRMRHRRHHVSLPAHAPWWKVAPRHARAALQSP